MKRIVKISVMLIVICVLCSGCDSWMSGEYLSITPHEVQSEPYANRVIEVTSYTQLRNAISNLVSNGAEDGIISISAFNKGTIHFYVDTAIANVIENTAFGAYAVEKITYEIGTNRGVSVVACKVHYRQGNILPTQIKHIENAEELSELITQALYEQDESVLVYMDQYEKLDIHNVVADYVAIYPDQVVEVPNVTVNKYPDKGAERIIEVTFDYEKTAIEMHQMRAKLDERFSAAVQSVDGVNNVEDICYGLYTYLMESASYRESETKIPAYDVMVNGLGDSSAFAVVYARMCIRSGVDCKTISGERDGQPWTWNVIRYRGQEYHVDLLHCYTNQEFKMNKEEQMEGYNWVAEQS